MRFLAPITVGLLFGFVVELADYNPSVVAAGVAVIASASWAGGYSHCRHQVLTAIAKQHRTNESETR